MRESRRVWDAIMIVADRIDARAVAIASLTDAFGGPRVGGTDRKAGRAVAFDRVPRNIFDYCFGQANVGKELVAPLLRDTLVRKTMTRKLVAGLGHASNQLGITLGDPSEREKCGLHIGFAQHRKNEVDVLLDPAWHRFPFAPLYVG